MVSGFAPAFIGLLILSLTFISCGDGNGDGDGGSTEIPIFPPTVFMAAKDVAGTVELYASFDDGREMIKLSANLVSGGNVVDFKISPDGIFAAYVADQETDQVFELYVVPVDKSAGDRAVKVSGFFMAGDGIKEISPGENAFAWAPDSSLVAYLADQRTAGVIELFSVLPNGTSNIRLSGNLGSDRDVVEFLWAPDSSRIVYLANQDFVNALELYSVLPNVTNSSQKITSGFDPGENVIDFAWAPSSQRVAFIADKNTPGLFQLWTTSSTNANNVLVSSVTPVGDGDVIEFAWAPVIGTNQIAYLADENKDEMFELFTTRGTDPVINLISLLQVDGSDVTEFAWAPDSSRVGYIADRLSDDVSELFTNLPRGGDNVKVSGDLTSDGDGGDVIDFAWAPDSALLAYSADQDTNNKFELYTSPPVSSTGNIKVSGTPMAGTGVSDFNWAPNSARLSYIADQNTADVFELFTSTPDGTVNDIVSGSLVAGGNVVEDKWAPDSSGIGYIADQDTDEVFELFASQPDGSDNTKLSGDLVVGGDVFAFEWVP
jgi:hypothetical protein